MNDEMTNAGPSRVWYVIGAALMMGAAIGAPVYLIWTLVSLMSSGEQFRAPGVNRFHLNKPGKYILWHDYRTVFDGRRYSVEQELPDGVVFTVTNDETHESVHIEASGGAHEQSGSSERADVCSFRIDAPGWFVVKIQGLPSLRIFTLRRPLLAPVLLTLAVSTTAGLFGFAAGVAMIVVTAVKRSRRKKG